ncbi:MAG: hypothetical protein HY782_14625 [Chloroflexi bacterium]|nr:hypothetical protein [Chloroflexota bacterium]
MQTKSYERFAGFCATVAGICAFLYAVSFIVLRSALLSSLFLTLVGLFATPVFVALYHRLRQTEMAFALWALIVGMTGAVGTAIHGGYDLAYNVNIPATPPPFEVLALPNQVDPRGLLTFGFTAIALFVFSGLITRSRVFSHALGYVGYVSAILLAILYLGRLIILDPANPVILGPALLNGFIVGPIWYLWLGAALWQHAPMVAVEFRGVERRVRERREPAMADAYSGVERRMGERRQAQMG